MNRTPSSNNKKTTTYVQKGNKQKPARGRKAPAKSESRLIVNLLLVICLTAASLFVCLWMAGSTLVDEGVFPQGTVVNGVSLGGMKYQDGLDRILAESQEEIDSMDVQFFYNDNAISLNADDLGIVACIEDLLQGACYSSSTSSSGFSAVLSPRQGQVIDASSLFDKTTIENTLKTALNEHDPLENQDYNITKTVISQEQPIMSIEYTTDDPLTKKVSLTVNIRVLHEYVAVPAADTLKEYDNAQLIKYKDMIEKYSAMYGLDPAFVTAMIFVESSFIETAESDAGAIGLMQLMPNTGNWIAGKIGITDYRIEMLTDPDVNIHMGCWYVSYLMDKFDDNTDVVIAAYNAGPRRVEEWLVDKRYSPDGKELTYIPYEETRNHVDRVNNHYEIYKGIYAEPYTITGQEEEAAAVQ